MLSQAEFESLIADPQKFIEGDIDWQKETQTRFSFRVEITSPAGYPLFLKATFNRAIPALSIAIIYAKGNRIYALDLGKEHRNPNGHFVGEKHKHRWSESLRDKQAYEPQDITASASDPTTVWEEFCKEAKITHNGKLKPLPADQLSLLP